MNDSPCIAFTGGGTGGHIYPGLAVAVQLKSINTMVRIIWIGSGNNMDRSIVEEAGIEFFGINSGKLRRYFSIKNFFDVFKIAAGFFNARAVLKKQKPQLLFSKGGFVSVPPVIAAASLAIPVWTHESDFSPGLATRINAKFAKKIFTAYEKTAQYFNEANRKKIILAGNPVRPVFYNADAAKGREFIASISKDFIAPNANKNILLVLGGSQGAKEINDLITKALPCLTKSFFVVHQTGAQDAGAPSSCENYLAIPFIKQEMPHVLAAASLVAGRSGAGTVWECAAVSRPMVLVPLSGSGTRGDQVENARYFEEKGAAITLIHPDKEKLLSVILPLAQDKAALCAMSESAAAIGRLNGAHIVSEAVINFLKELKL